MTGIIITKLYHDVHAALGIQTCLFPVEGRLQRTSFLREVDERPCGKWGVNCVAPVLFRDQNESQAVVSPDCCCFPESIMTNSL